MKSRDKRIHRSTGRKRRKCLGDKIGWCSVLVIMTSPQPLYFTAFYKEKTKVIDGNR